MNVSITEPGMPMLKSVYARKSEGDMDVCNVCNVCLCVG